MQRDTFRLSSSTVYLYRSAIDGAAPILSRGYTASLEASMRLMQLRPGFWVSQDATSSRVDNSAPQQSTMQPVTYR